MFYWIKCSQITCGIKNYQILFQLRFCVRFRFFVSIVINRVVKETPTSCKRVFQYLYRKSLSKLKTHLTTSFNYLSFIYSKCKECRESAQFSFPLRSSERKMGSRVQDTSKKRAFLKYTMQITKDLQDHRNFFRKSPVLTLSVSILYRNVLFEYNIGCS